MKRFSLLLISLLAALAVCQAQDDNTFEKGYTQAKVYYLSGKYADALKELERVSYIAVSDKEINMVNDLYKSCRYAQAENSKLQDLIILDSTLKDVDYNGGEISLGYEVVNPKKSTVLSVTIDPEYSSWIHSAKVDQAGKRITFSVYKNDSKRINLGQILVKKGTSKEYITVHQDKRPEVKRSLVISTTPRNATIIADGITLEQGHQSIEVEGGKNVILSVNKNGYKPHNETIHISDDPNDTSPLRVEINLQPNFGLVCFDVKAEDGFSLDTTKPDYSQYVVRINSEEVRMDPASLKTFDDNDDVKGNRAYRDADGKVWIPVFYGQTRYHVSSDGFTDVADTVSVREGRRRTIPIVLKAKTGTLSINSIYGDNRAIEAEVYLDGNRLLGTVPFDHVRVMEGEHTLSLVKPGHIAVGPEENYRINIAEGEHVERNVQMKRFVEYQFLTQPGYDQLYIDGELIDNRELKVTLLEKDGINKYHIELFKKGFDPIVDDIFLKEDDFDLGLHLYPEEGRAEFIQLIPLKLSADEGSVVADIYQKNPHSKDVRYFAEKVTLPATVNIPYSSQPYRIKIKRAVVNNIGKVENFNDVAYRGQFNFKEKSPRERHFFTDSKNALQIIDISYNLNTPRVFNLGDPAAVTTAIYNYGDLSLLKFKLFKGFSTSAVKASVFAPKPFDINGMDIYIPKADGTPAEVGVDEPATLFPVLPAFSMILLNDEFRIGVRALEYANINALVRYTWYPDIFKYFLNFSHFTGHELFVGGEIGSRVPVIGLNVRAGMQMYFAANAHLYHNNPRNEVTNSDFRGYYTKKLDIPPMFVVSVSLNLGPTTTKGHNVLDVARF